MMRSSRIGLIAIVGFAFSVSAHAKFYDMYRADYAKGAFCAAVAGACASDNNPENAFFQNPAALESDKPDLVYDLDYNPSENLEPGMKLNSQMGSTSFMAGFAHTGEQWGTGFAFSGRTVSLDAVATLYDDKGNPQNLVTADSNFELFFNIPFAWKVNPKLSLGVALVGLYYRENFDVQNSPQSGTSPIDRFPQLGLSFGFLYEPNSVYRVGSWLRTPITYYVNQQIVVQQFSNNIVISEDLGLHYPLVWSNGVSYMPWQDRRTFLFDLDLIGTTSNGFERTLDTFTSLSNDRSLRPKGTSVALEPHLAYRAPWWFNPKGTYTAGVYLENSRWDGLPSRWHGVTSFAYDVGILETIVAVDFARDYFNLQFSFR